MSLVISSELHQAILQTMQRSRVQTATKAVGAVDSTKQGVRILETRNSVMPSHSLGLSPQAASNPMEVIPSSYMRKVGK